MTTKLEDGASASTTSTTGHPGIEAPSLIKYKGVRKRKWGKWVSEIRLPNSRRRIWLGSYDSPEKAARAFDAAQYCLRGPAANFNFPNNPPEIPGGRSMSPAEIQAAAARFADGPFEDAIVTRRETAPEEQYSPSVSDGPTVQTGWNGGFGSDNFASGFGLYDCFDEFAAHEYYSQQPDNNFDYGGAEDHDNSDASIFLDPFLWNF